MATVTQTDVLPEVAAFLGSSPLGSVIGGQQVSSSNQAVFTTVDPGSRETLAEVYAMQPDDVARAVEAAARAFAESGWAKMAPNDRGVLLHRLADEVEKRKQTIAQIEALDCGKIYWQAEGDVQNFVDTMQIGRAHV